MTSEKTNLHTDPLLKQLFTTCSPSCREYEIINIFREWLRTNNYQTISTPLGNVIGCINPSAEFKLLFSAHADEIGLQITQINDQGLLSFRRVGGIEVMSLCGHEVVILNKRAPIPGIIGRSAQDHNLTETGISFTLNDLWIDIGAENREDAESKVEIGDFVAFKPNLRQMGDHKVCSKGIDNKIGVFILIKMLEEISKEQLSIGVYIAATIEEEIGLKGISACANMIKPDLGFIIDTGYATDIPEASANKSATFSLGKGVGLVLNGDNSLYLINYINEIADKLDIPIQKTLGLRLSGGTDAAALRLCHIGVPTANLSIPCRYMHSHTEMCDWRDIEHTIQLSVSIIREINNKQTNQKHLL